MLPPDVIRGSLESVRQHNLPHEILEAAELRRRFPPFTPSSDEVALYEHKAGYLFPEEAICQMLKRAARLGADLHFEEPVEAWSADDLSGCVQVKTAKATYNADRLIICSGAWSPEVLSVLELPLTVTRQVMFWFDPIGGVDPFLPQHFPIYMWQPEGSRIFYGFPSIDGKSGGVKVAVHGSDDVCTPGIIDRTVNALEVQAMKNLLAKRIPQLNGNLITAKTCMYTMTPDENFIVGIHPHHSSVLLAAGFSGHGFKFSTVIGEILADLAVGGATRHNIELFSPHRFKGDTRLSG